MTLQKVASHGTGAGIQRTTTLDRRQYRVGLLFVQVGVSSLGNESPERMKIDDWALAARAYVLRTLLMNLESCF